MAPTRRALALAMAASIIVSLLVLEAPAADASSGSEENNRASVVGTRALPNGHVVVDPHNLADHGLLSALASADMLDAYLERGDLDPRTAILRVEDPSDGFRQARAALVRAAARHQSTVAAARRVDASFEPWHRASDQPRGSSVARSIPTRDERSRYVASHAHPPAVLAAIASTADIITLIQQLHGYRRGETLAGVELQGVVFDAYLLGQTATAERDGCDVRWTTFAAIGHSESRHGTLHDATVNVWGDPSRSLLGPLLDGGESKRAPGEDAPEGGNGFAVVRDSDRGEYDGNARWDRAIGPMQFLPSTWMVWSADGNGDGWENPQNMYDAVAGAANLLCGLIEERGSDPHRYLLGYNGSSAYVRKVLGDAAAFEELFLPEIKRTG